MDVTIRVTWADGSVSEHSVPGMPYDDVVVVEEVLNRKLADYLEHDEWPGDDEGLLASVSVEIVG